jgi:hypothetical protein
MNLKDFNNGVFINCPFDKDYDVLFKAVVFTIFDCGFVARCALELQDASQIRIEKIYKIISECKYGIHDLSRTERDSDSHLPRFNMPLELGIFLGSKKFGSAQHKKQVCLIMDKEKYRYQKYISDISGQDISSHNNDYKECIRIIRNWLRSASRRTTIPGSGIIIDRYTKFRKYIPKMCTILKLDQNDLIFNDYTWMVSEWLKEIEKEAV